MAVTAPLAYVRRAVVAPVTLLHEAAPLPRQDRPDRAPGAANASGRRAPIDEPMAALPANMPALFDDAMVGELGRIPGLSALRGVTDGAPVLALGKDGPILGTNAAEYARKADADAAVFAAIDRVGSRTVLDRTLWVRALAVVAPAGGGPATRAVYAYGSASSRRRWFVAGDFVRDDAALLSDAVQQAARELARALETGRERFASRDTRIAILPAAVPAGARRHGTQPDAATHVVIPALSRIADTLFQPELPFTAEVISAEAAEVASAGAGVHRSSGGGGLPEPEALARVAHELGADYVFASHVDGLLLSDRPIQIATADGPRAGIERTASATVEALLYRAADGAVIWRHTTEGSVTARTEVVRGREKLRAEDRCAIDAVRTAYAYLRFDFAEFLRRTERSHRATRLP
ncbi:MAG TPA: hypothetical protein VLH79_16470 [Chthonomonadales bacterium]|nr:hypothetical protein [Chthonomonadales bacterium]